MSFFIVNENFRIAQFLYNLGDCTSLSIRIEKFNYWTYQAEISMFPNLFSSYKRNVHSFSRFYRKIIIHFSFDNTTFNLCSISDCAFRNVWSNSRKYYRHNFGENSKISLTHWCFNQIVILLIKIILIMIIIKNIFDLCSKRNNTSMLNECMLINIIY